MRKILCFLLCTACLSFARAADYSADARGTTGAQFLELPVGARAIAMGSAYSSISGDPFSAYYNPAGLASIDKFNAGLMHAVYFQDISYEYGVFTTPIKELGVIAISAQYLAVSKLAEIDKTGVATGDSFKPNDMAVSAIYAKQFGVVDFGVSAKYIQSQILNSASTFAGDIGLQTKVGNFRFGLSVLNIGKGLKFLDEENSLPTTGRIGASVLLTPRWFLSVDGIAPKGNNLLMAAGTEYKRPLTQTIKVSLRAGYNSRYATSKLGGMAGVNAGAGLDFGSINVDYAWSPYGDLGVTHRFSLSMRLGGDDSRKQSARSAYSYRRPEPEFEQEAQALTPELPTETAEAVVAAPDGEKTYQDYLEAADGYISQKDYKNAATEYAEALKALPENDKRRIYTFEQQGQISAKLKDISKAKEFYLAAITTAKKLNVPDSGVINSYLGLAYCFEKSGNIAPAIKNYEKALELSTSDSTKIKIRGIIEKLEMIPDGQDS